MKEMCAICGGDKKAGTSTFTVDYGVGILVARNVPAKVCQQCGESWVNDVMAKKLEDKTKEAKTSRRQLEVIDLKKAA
ncbi:MAG: type II toxin-antitoxin system MqsA family antitoxin [Candidatus Omnitrophica bacterium]|nr:type II toxin-antitoxin system MqsA family antitoxin [Candidatus Omnitrophota bacterium]